MALSRIWSAFIIVAIIVASIKLMSSHSEATIFSKMVIGKQGDTSNTKVLDSMALSPVIIKTIAEKKEYKEGDVKFKKEKNNYISFREQSADGVIQTCWNAVEMCLKLIGILAFFMGLMSIAEKAGGIRLLSKIVGPFFSKLFPEVPKGHPATGHMVMNFSANLLGLDNAATPFGLKAMESLQELNPNKSVASNSQIMFLCLHAAGLSLIPVSVIALRASSNASDPTDIFIPCLIVTFVGTMTAMLIVSFKQKINIFQPVILGWILSISAVIALLVWYITTLNSQSIAAFSGTLSSGVILFIVLAILLGGVYKKIDVFDAFVDGAKGGFETAVKIIPYLVGMLVAISMLRTSGTFDVVILGIKNFFAFLGADTRFVEALPTALIRPLSGGGARGMMVDTMTAYGPDSFASRLSGVFQGAADTTFYVIAVYFGSVSVKNTRYAIGTMLIADLAGVCTAIGLAYLFFGNS
ncbi:nucleoside recognition domain-containing protein [Pedobacter sp. SL55]|uniref:nucleoside recognition domain-containing protein n=1 Tax=Pedobacter sp. SL55 TaxID=2995161 RepID=UPI00227179D1|nr:spore maturation protein [Pedobacter sp. SL55]WAC39921.1 spore maturation protein [Pedobacter sp. SL55]